jgi:O-methyltransferase
MNLRWVAKKLLPKSAANVLRRTLPEAIYYPGYGGTTLSTKKADSLASLVNDVLSKRLAGDLIECGVYRGGSLAAIAKAAKAIAPEKRVFGADTFEGHPFDGPEDMPANHQLVHHKGLFAGNSYDNVAAMLRDRGLTNAILLKGLVGDTLPTLGEPRFCFAHLDLDLYLSTRQALAFIAPRLVSGGAIVFDDFGGYETPGVEKAVHEVLAGARIVRTIDSADGSQGYWVKP